MIYRIDVTDKILGRIASEIAVILRGKNKPSFKQNVESTDTVEVVNVRNLKVTGNKEEKKFYWRYTGYPGGIKRTTYSEMMRKYPKRILWKAVRGMLPKNRLRAKLLKHLIIT